MRQDSDRQPGDAAAGRNKAFKTLSAGKITSLPPQPSCPTTAKIIVAKLITAFVLLAQATHLFCSRINVTSSFVMAAMAERTHSGAGGGLVCRCN